LAGHPLATQESAFQWIENLSLSELAMMRLLRGGSISAPSLPRWLKLSQA
jgi:hypothetical protein